MSRGYPCCPASVKSLPGAVPELRLDDRRARLAGPGQQRRSAFGRDVGKALARPGAVRVERRRVQPPVPRIALRRVELLPEPGRREELERPAQLQLEPEAGVRHAVAPLVEVGE